MPAQTRRSTSRRRRPTGGELLPAEPLKLWGTKTRAFPKAVMDNLYRVAYGLDSDSRQRLGLAMLVPIFVQDPWVARENPLLGIDLVPTALGSRHG